MYKDAVFTYSFPATDKPLRAMESGVILHPSSQGAGFLSPVQNSKRKPREAKALAQVLVASGRPTPDSHQASVCSPSPTPALSSEDLS